MFTENSIQTYSSFAFKTVEMRWKTESHWRPLWKTLCISYTSISQALISINVNIFLMYHSLQRKGHYFSFKTKMKKKKWCTEALLGEERSQTIKITT